MHYLYDYLWEDPTEIGVRNLLTKTSLKYYTDAIIENCNKLEPRETYGVKYLDTKEEAESKAALESKTTNLNEDDVSYNIDRFGLRYTGIDFLEDKVDSLVFGCSFTYGIGVPLEKTWAYLINNGIPENNYTNLAVPGSSISKLTRMLYSCTEYTKPKKVFILLPDYNREEIVVEDEHTTSLGLKDSFKIYDFVPRYMPEDKEALYHVKNYMSTLVTENNKINTFKNLQTIKLIAKLLNIDLYISSWCPWTYSMLEKVFNPSQIAPLFFFTNNPEHILYARDGGHPGVEDNKIFAQDVLKFMKNNNNGNKDVI